MLTGNTSSSAECLTVWFSKIFQNDSILYSCKIIFVPVKENTCFWSLCAHNVAIVRWSSGIFSVRVPRWVSRRTDWRVWGRRNSLSCFTIMWPLNHKGSIELIAAVSRGPRTKLQWIKGSADFQGQRPTIKRGNVILFLRWLFGSLGFWSILYFLTVLLQMPACWPHLIYPRGLEIVSNHLHRPSTSSVKSSN